MVTIKTLGVPHWSRVAEFTISIDALPGISNKWMRKMCCLSAALSTHIEKGGDL
jgi:hypothetical protein